MSEMLIKVYIFFIYVNMKILSKRDSVLMLKHNTSKLPSSKYNSQKQMDSHDSL